MDGAPINWPRVTVAGREFVIEFSHRTTYRASKAGVDLRKLANAAESFATFLDLFAIITEGQLSGMGLAPKSGEDWAGELEEGDFQKISKAIGEAYQLSRKKSPATMTPAPQAEETGPPN